MESNTSLSRNSNDVEDRRVGLIYDERMCKHYAPDEEDHPECPGRIRAIWDRLNSSGLAERCVILNAKDAEDKHLALVHTKSHINLIKNISSRNYSQRKKSAAKYDSIYFNEGSSEAAYLAAGSVIEVTEKVAKGELDSAFAIVRPPGHHAEHNKPMGFSLHNNVAIATSYILNERSELGIKKILIVDWDVHHGNGTQNMFYKDPRVLFFSVHRFDPKNFYPLGHKGSYIMTGKEPGGGYNINVPWVGGKCGDADYVAVWDHILVHVAKEFNPDLIMISAGFDAAVGDPLGDCRVSPYGFSVLLKKLLDFAGGKIVMALEGGYNLNSIANSAHACVEVLLQAKPIAGSLEAFPFESTWRVINKVRQKLSTYWPSLSEKLPDNVTNRTSPIETLVYHADPKKKKTVDAGTSAAGVSPMETDRPKTKFDELEIERLLKIDPPLPRSKCPKLLESPPDGVNRAWTTTLENQCEASDQACATASLLASQASSATQHVIGPMERIVRENKESQKAVCSLKIENSNLKRKLTEAETHRDNQNAAIEKYKSEVELLKSSLEEKKKDMEKLQSSLNRQESELGALKKENDQLIQELDDVKKDRDSLDKELSDIDGVPYYDLEAAAEYIYIKAIAAMIRVAKLCVQHMKDYMDGREINAASEQSFLDLESAFKIDMSWWPSYEQPASSEKNFHSQVPPDFVEELLNADTQLSNLSSQDSAPDT